jgi:hypothetical protein
MEKSTARVRRPLSVGLQMTDAAADADHKQALYGATLGLATALYG